MLLVKLPGSLARSGVSFMCIIGAHIYLDMELEEEAGFYTISLFRGHAVALPSYHPWHTMAYHGNPTACHDNPHGLPMSTAPRLGLGLGSGLGSGLGLGLGLGSWYAVEVRGRFRGML